MTHTGNSFIELASAFQQLCSFAMPRDFDEKIFPLKNRDTMASCAQNKFCGKIGVSAQISRIRLENSKICCFALIFSV